MNEKVFARERGGSYRGAGRPEAVPSARRRRMLRWIHAGLREQLIRKEPSFSAARDR